MKPNTKLTREELEKYDCFCNLNKIIEVNCPIFFIHGLKDEAIPHSHSLEMASKVGFPYQWYPRLGTHNNIMTFYRKKFYSKLKTFMEHVRDIYCKKLKKDTYYSNIYKYGIKFEENYLENEEIKINGEEEKIQSKKVTDQTLSSHFKAVSTNNAYNLLSPESHNKKNNLIIAEKVFYEPENQDNEKMSLVNTKNEYTDEEYRTYQKQLNGII